MRQEVHGRRDGFAHLEIGLFRLGLGEHFPSLGNNPLKQRLRDAVVYCLCRERMLVLRDATNFAM